MSVYFLVRSTIYGTWPIRCWTEKPGLKIDLHLFQKGPSVVTRLAAPAKGSRAVTKASCFSRTVTVDISWAASLGLVLGQDDGAFSGDETHVSRTMHMAPAMGYMSK